MIQSKTPQLSVIIPTLNEDQNIIVTLEALINRAFDPEQIELIVVDGGSGDQTQTLIRHWQENHPQHRLYLLEGPAGRARQMNLGASSARGEILYFIHADTLAPQNYDQLIIENTEPKHEAGCFRMAFDSKHWWMKLAGWGTRFKWQFCRGGDQSLFVRKALFEGIGGYAPEYIICEDLHLIDRLYARTHFRVLPQKVISSARKYNERGLWQLQWHFWVIQYKYRQDHSPQELWAYYQRNVWQNTPKKSVT
ncbi:MAG TPA: glycosyl transferase family 2 [Flavobacteriaceae bacterium]|nr:glycosyl transferase family 2 [Flavobacteriaceae bacterium]